MTRMIRVAFVTGGLVPGGAERQMLLLAEGLPKDEFAVDFICLKLAGEYADRARAAGARVRVLGLKGKRESGWPLPAYATYLTWTAARYVAMMAGRYDVVDAWLYHAYALAAITRPMTRPRGLIAGRRSLSGFKSRFNRLERIADAIARRETDLLVANSEAVKADVVSREGVDPGRIRVIHNAVQPPEPMTSTERHRRRAGWAASDETIVIGCVANYKPFKGLELLLRVAARLTRDGGGRDIRLVLVGDGKHRPVLEGLREQLGLEDVVVLNGVEPEARNVYGAFDIAVLASEAEGLPNVVLEAAAAGLPIVATAAGGTVEIIDDGRTGLLVPIGDEDAFFDAVARLCDNPEERRRLGDAARSEVAARFGVQRMIDEFSALYRELAGRGRGVGAAK
jgi:glycosyltransferase involved in cell wall biosynthesis